MPRRASLLIALAMAGAAVFACGCGGGSQVKVVVRAADDANGRRPFYVLVRSVTDKTYLEEAYQSVAGKVMAPDASVLESAVVFPGAPRTITFTPPEKGEIGVYFLLTRPSGPWKSLVTLPAPNEVEFSIEGSAVRRK